MKSSLFDSVLVTLGVVSVVASIVFIKWEDRSDVRVVQSPPEEVANWNELRHGAAGMGPASARVQIVEFSDFQCPFCSAMAEELRGLRADHPADVAVVYRHFPIARLHPFARAAAFASECARRDGAFQAFHDEVFSHQGDIGTVGWAAMATRSGVRDTAGFARCMRDSIPAARIDSDMARGRALQISGTPTLIVNGLLYRNGIPAVTLRHVVDSVLRADLPPSASSKHAPPARD